jgi:hypothetical protein
VNVSAGPVTVSTSSTAFTPGTSSPVIGPFITTAGTTIVGACVRTAFLVLGSSTLQLEDLRAGYVCQSLDLGFPEVREVKTHRPDQDGSTDRTQYMGARVVTAQVTALKGAGAQIDAIVTRFAPFMVPSARPVLHYVLDRPGTPERTLTLRGAGFTWAVNGPAARDMHLQWVAADPIARDPTMRSVFATPSAPATIVTLGDVAVRPRFRVVGPITGAVMSFSPPLFPTWKLGFVSSYVIAGGHFVEIDTDARTVFLDGDRTQPQLSFIDWTQSSWQWVPPATSTTMTLTGSATAGPTQAIAYWQDGYLT